jgi:hypothetical protein
MAQIRAHLAAADEARAASMARAEREEKQTKYLQKRLRASGENPPASRPLPQVDSAAASKPTGMSQMFRDAMMKEGLRSEAKVAIVKTVQKLFDAGLAARLQLNPEQSASLRQLLTERASILWEKMLVPMTTGEIDEASMASAGQAIKQAIDDNAAQIRALLGDDGYSAYQWFDKTQSERDEANGFAAAASAVGHNLTADQQSQLLDLMTTERAGFKFQYDLGDPAKLDFEHWFDNFSDEKINAYQQDMEQLNGRIVQGAQGVLTPDQSAQLNDFLNQNLFESLVTVRSTAALMTKN